MLTIFTIPKPFRGSIEIIQRNALRSWINLQPKCEIILCGDEPGVRKAALDFGVKHISNIARNEFGTPLINSAFDKVVEVAQFPILCYVNADIILLNDLMTAIKRIPFRPFMAVGQRTNVTIAEELFYENTKLNSKIVTFVNKNGHLADVNWIDCFVFTPNGQLEQLLPFTVGRAHWDNWFIYHARKLHVPVVDITRVCTVIHQNHDYPPILMDPGVQRYTPPIWAEGNRNKFLYIESLGSHHLCNINDATHILSTRHIFPALNYKYLLQRWNTGLVLRPAVKQIDNRLRPFYKLLKRFISVR